MNKNTIILSLFLCIIGCNTPNNKEKEVGHIYEKIDLSSFSEKETEDIPEFLIKSKIYIKFGNSDTFLFRGIDKIKIEKNKIFILDKRLKRLLVFNMEGQGIGLVGKLGQGPEEYLQITDFDVDNSGNVYIIDGVSNKLFIYNSTFEFVSSTKLKFEADIIQCLNNHQLMIGLSTWNKGDYAHSRIIITDTSLKPLYAHFKYDEYVDESYWISGYTFIKRDSLIYYNKPIDNNVYLFSDTGDFIKIYQFDFGKRNVEDKDKKNIEGNLDKYENYCCLKNFTVITEKYIIGSLWDKTKTKFFIADRNNKVIYKSVNFADSDLSYLTGIYENYIISYIYPGKYENINLVNIPPEIKEAINNENIVLCLNELK